MNDTHLFKLVIFVYLILAITMILHLLNCTYNYDKRPYPIQSDEPVIIWNDDFESIPPDGSLVRIEMTVNDTIYLSSN